MKGKSPLFQKRSRNLTFKLYLQFFAQKRVSDVGMAIQKSLTSQKLKNLVGELYREGAIVGDGSAMAAASKQVRSGNLINGKDHVIKIEQRIANLNNIMKKENLNDSDLKYAKKLLNDMEKSLKGEY